MTKPEELPPPTFFIVLQSIWDLFVAIVLSIPRNRTDLDVEQEEQLPIEDREPASDMGNCVQICSEVDDSRLEVEANEERCVEWETPDKDHQIDEEIHNRGVATLQASKNDPISPVQRAADRVMRALRLQTEARATEDEMIAQAEEAAREREEENRKWEARLLALAVQRQQIRNDYTEMSSIAQEESNAELCRIAEKSIKAEEIFEDTIREVQEGIDRTFEDSRNLRIMQTTKMLELWRIAVWSKQAEAQWSDRLFSLRRSHEPVCFRFNALSDFVLYEMQNGGISLASYEHISGELTLLKEELEVEIKTMENEVLEMQRFKDEYPEAEFLMDIEESSRAVADAATILLREIEELENEEKLGVEPMSSITKINHCKLCFDKLEKTIDEIPNVMDLKEKYQHQYY